MALKPKDKRPKIKLELSFTDKLLEIVGWAALYGIWVVAIVYYRNLPDTIPVHFDGLGRPDGFGRKAIFWVFPITATVLFAGMTLLNRLPHLFNYPKRITPDNALRQYTTATRLIRYLKLVIVIMFGFIALGTAQIALEKQEGLGVWSLPVLMGILFIPLAYFLVKLLR